jgi:PhnB protein
MPTYTSEAVFIPLLVVRDARAAIAFYATAFGAIEAHEPAVDPTSGKVVYAEIRIGANRIAVKDEDSGRGGDPAPDQLGGSSVILTMQVPDVDAVFDSAVAAGASVKYLVGDRPYGYRDGRLVDPLGHVWIIQTALPPG